MLIENADIPDLGEDPLAPLRNSTFGFVFRSFHLVPSLSALESVVFLAERAPRPRRSLAASLSILRQKPMTFLREQADQ